MCVCVLSLFCFCCFHYLFLISSINKYLHSILCKIKGNSIVKIIVVVKNQDKIEHLYMNKTQGMVTKCDYHGCKCSWFMMHTALVRCVCLYNIRSASISDEASAHIFNQQKISGMEWMFLSILSLMLSCCLALCLAW